MSPHFENYEESHFEKDNKEHKRNKKILEKKDRSKFKKTDNFQKIQVKPAESDSLFSGRVISVESEGAIVFDDETKNYYMCAVKGTLKYEVSREKNLLTIGDFVKFEKLPNLQGQIFQIQTRQSTLYRADNFSRRKMQLIAANIDQVLITISCVHPSIKPALIDRYLIAAERGNMTPIILITKIDLIQEDPEAIDVINYVAETYKKLGYKTLTISTVNLSGIQELKELMKNKASVFSGQSGVGKTSLINLLTGNSFKTNSIIEKTMKGSHTTSKSHLVPLECGGFCIDTPGIRSFGMWDLKKEEVKNYFPEILSEGIHCKFKNCTHQNEPDCAVKKAVEENKIAQFRYESYLNLLLEELPTEY